MTPLFLPLEPRHLRERGGQRAGELEVSDLCPVGAPEGGVRRAATVPGQVIVQGGQVT